tara:strand:- start:297 stop:542 length:246 start_codon:yes stop_codon:yes gene_type:complete
MNSIKEIENCLERNQEKIRDLIKDQLYYLIEDRCQKGELITNCEEIQRLWAIHEYLLMKLNYQIWLLTRPAKNQDTISEAT